MYKEKSIRSKNGIKRLIFVILSILLQVTWMTLLIVKLNAYSMTISIVSSIIALLVVLGIYGFHTNSAFKMPWIMLILISPVLGLCLYVLLGRSGLSNKMEERFLALDRKLDVFLPFDQKIVNKLRKQDKAIANQVHYLEQYGKFPVYQNTDVDFFGFAESCFEAQKEAIRNAKSFIFLEYFAIEDAIAFEQLREILVDKVNQGVEVRLLYDDIGSIGYVNKDFVQKMETLGIQCRIFNPLVPFLKMFMNNRDHRKITVIDGFVGFTGGYNIADEYFNITHPYGHWKDSAVKLTGDAVRTLTLLFLETWNAMKETDTDYERFLPSLPADINIKGLGYVQPYADSPLDNEPVGENVYMNIIKNAKDYVYFTTPYLIISDEMHRELCLAAKRGVDVRLITPGIPDKKLVFKVTQSYYARLIYAGIRIFEYSPGFIHAKECVCDDEVATVGTINLDYRSLYLHFEDGVLLYDCPAVYAIKQDFEDTFPVCTEITEKYHGKRPAMLRVSQCIMRLFAPLL